MELTASAFLYISWVLICKTIRYDIPWRERFEKRGENVIFAVWHQATFVMFYLYRFRRVVLLVSSEPRGRVLAQCARWLGYEIIAVNFQRDKLATARAMGKMIKLIKEGYDAVVAVDGPSGPPFAVKPGVFFLAEKAGVPIVPVGLFSPLHIKLFWRWDRYIIPFPFSRSRIRKGPMLLPGTGTPGRLKDILARLSR
ncbi:MAG: DUF374 domain-containing protein [Candidatus Margulisbacteria bacterium]|nr:DUF374 domain-containing protein [Candidatus Margulisiibacteriota bacterium]